jgi:hypothetical protein
MAFASASRRLGHSPSDRPSARSAVALLRNGVSAGGSRGHQPDRPPVGSQFHGTAFIRINRFAYLTAGWPVNGDRLLRRASRARWWWCGITWTASANECPTLSGVGQAGEGRRVAEQVRTRWRKARLQSATLVRRTHYRPLPRSWRISQARANCQSRFTVRGDVPITLAVSSSLIPPK